MAQYSIRALLVLVTVVAIALAIGAECVREARVGWERENAAFLDGGGVRDGDYYVPNLAVEHTCLLPEWVAGLFPRETREVFYRVTTLDMSDGPGHAEDFEPCLVFEHVTSIKLHSVYKAEQFAAVLKRFPRLKRIELGQEFAADGPTSQAEVFQRELPGVEIVAYW